MHKNPFRTGCGKDFLQKADKVFAKRGENFKFFEQLTFPCTAPII
jgi:hypothetical protein